MAKINESVLVVKVSELVKDNEDKPNPLSEDMVNQPQAVIQELAGPQTLVEIERPNGSKSIILTNKEELSFTGEKFKGDGFYGYADGLHTISSPAFVGRLSQMPITRESWGRRLVSY